MKKKSLVLCFVLIVAIIVISLPVITEVFDFTSTQGAPVTVTIPQGTPVNNIAQILKDNNLLKSKLAFKIKVKLFGYNQLNWGTYDLNSGMCLGDILEELSSSRGVKQILITIPEGFSVQQIAQRAENEGICKKEDFLKALSDEYDYGFIKYIPDGEYDYKLQGFLYPETYSFIPNTDPHTVIDVMLATFDEKYKQSIGEYDSNIFEIITKASLVEKEAKLEKERPVISGVIENRIKIDMPLQIDAAIAYAVTGGRYDVEGVTLRDLEVESPYNIYRNPGLPAGPICNPGMTSIKSILNPQSHKYLYYHTDNQKNDGSHIFSETYSGHLNTMN